ncbi:MAG: KH domain-containing protein [Cyanothece sp. SIO1E1]|nr:KH domain-containing protein [Cyanothece sp. SIO1E1]
MSLSRSVPDLIDTETDHSSSTTPDFEGLVRFLIEPFLDSPDSLRVNCEVSSSRAKAWIRLAFEGEDKGRVFGRGGRNIQAIRTALKASAQLSGYSVYLDIYGSHSESADNGNRNRRPGVRTQPRRPPKSRPQQS